jgi:aquaporin NIP
MLAEALGVFVIVFGGCGAIVTNRQYDDAIGAVGVALAFGLIVVVAFYAASRVSGGHINPAVTLALTVNRQFPVGEALAYIGAQLIGGAIGALTLLAAWPTKPSHLGATVPTVGVGSAFVHEFILTALLMAVIMTIRSETRATSEGLIAIGALVGLAGLMAGPVTGASLNPARSFGPALVTGDWQDFWVYVAGPVAGAAVGAFTYRLIRGEHLELLGPPKRDMADASSHGQRDPGPGAVPDQS